jgi:small GTP-binding protein
MKGIRIVFMLVFHMLNNLSFLIVMLTASRSRLMIGSPRTSQNRTVKNLLSLFTMLQGQRPKWCIVTVGDYAVGKTCLIKAITRAPFCDQDAPTIGMDPFQTVVYDKDTAIDLVIWDTAGQERFKSLVPVYSRRSDAALVVFDMTNQDSFDGIGEKVESFRRIAETAKLVFLVGTKMDLRDEIQVKKDEAIRWAKSKDLPIFFTSAKDGTGIDELTSELGHRFVGTQSAVPTSVDLAPTGTWEATNCC